MESPDTSRKLAAIDRSLIEHRIHAIFERRAAGYLEGMCAYAAPDIVINGGTWPDPFPKSVQGKDVCKAVMRQVNIFYENLGCQIRQLAIDGDRAAVHRVATIRNRGTGVVTEIDICDFLKCREGLVVEFSEYPDTLAVARLEGRTP